MIITIKPKKETILKVIPTSLKPIFKNKGPIANNNISKPTIMVIIPAIPLIILPPFLLISQDI